MKISPVSSTGTTIGAVEGGEVKQSVAQRIRALKMKTNATPGRLDEDEQPSEVAPQTAVISKETAQPAEGLSISDNNSETAKPDEATQPLSPQLAALAKARRALQQERADFDKQKADFEAQRVAPAGGIDLARLKSDPLGVMLENGITFDQLTEATLAYQQSGASHAQIKALQDQIKTLEEGFNKKFSEKEEADIKAGLAEMNRQGTRMIAEGNEFELIRETGSLPAVMQLIEQTYRKEGEVLDVREALMLYEEELQKDTLKLANLAKVKSKLMPEAPSPQPPQQQQRQMRTLTNRDGVQPALSRRARAIAKFNGNNP